MGTFPPLKTNGSGATGGSEAVAGLGASLEHLGGKSCAHLENKSCMRGGYLEAEIRRQGLSQCLPSQCNSLNTFILALGPKGPHPGLGKGRHAKRQSHHGQHFVCLFFGGPHFEFSLLSME